MRKYRNATYLRNEYLEKRKTSVEIAKDCNCDISTICNWLRRHDIPRRPVYMASNPWNFYRAYIDKDWLEWVYIEQRLSMLDIGTICGVTEQSIFGWIKKFGIQTRTLSDSHLLIGDYNNKDILYHYYIEEELGCKKISSFYDVHPAVIQCWLHRHNIQTRIGGMSGSKNANWRDGKSFEIYPAVFNFELKEEIRNRDNRTCQLCGKSELLEGRRLSVHHINGNKLDCRKNNLVTLCNPCNSKSDTVEKEFLLIVNIGGYHIE